MLNIPNDNKIMLKDRVFEKKIPSTNGLKLFWIYFDKTKPKYVK